MAAGATDWAAIETPSGKAGKVPSHLEGLSAADAKLRKKSLSALRRLALYEGEVTSAAVPLAPHLVDLARDDATPELAGVLLLLADLLVCGEADRWIGIGYDVRTPAFESALPDQYGRALYESISAGAPAYLAHLAHASPAVRAHVAPLLAYLSREHAAIEPAVRARTSSSREKEPAVRAALAIALAHQARYANDGSATELLVALLDDADATTRVGAAAGLAATLGAEAPTAVAEILVEAAKKQRKKVADFPFFEGNLANLAVVVGSRLAGARGDLALAESLVAASKKLPTQLWAIGAMVDAAFAKDERPTPRAPGELDAKQRAAVLSVVASGESERIHSALARAGLPADPKALACVAGEDPPTSLARVVAGEPLLRAATRALRTAEAEARWHAMLATMSDAERIDIARDAHCHPLRIWSLPRPSGVDPARDAFVIDDRTTRALLDRAMEIVATDLALCAPSSLVIAMNALGREDLKPPGYIAALALGACEASARAGLAVPVEVDAWLAKINPLSSFANLERLRRALALLPADRLEQVVLARHCWHKVRPEPGEAAIGGLWVIADLARTPAVAEAIVKEIASWTGGSAPYPEDFAVDLLRSFGAAAHAPIEAALATSPKVADVLRRLVA